MANDLNQSLYVEDEINLKEIFKILIESKKLIISTILIFTTAGIIYSLSLNPSFLTSTQLEIGYFEKSNGDKELIESTNNLNSDLKILLFKSPDENLSDEVSIDSFEDKIINLEITSNSIEKNNNFMRETINYIVERHSQLKKLITYQKKLRLFDEIDLIKSELSFIKVKQQNENESKKLAIIKNLESIKSKLSFIKTKLLNQDELNRSEIQDKINKLKAELPFIEIEINQLNQVIIEDTKNLSLLTKNGTLLLERASNSPTLEQIIFSYKSKINDLNKKKNTNLITTKKLSNQLKTLENDNLQSDEIFRLQQEQKVMENQLKTLENDNLQSDEIFRLQQEQKVMENLLRNLMDQTQVDTSLIGNIETKTLKPKIVLITILSLFIGFFTGILLVFIRNFVRNYKESEA
ncbi:Wzz/FepE/Etk N-terminal domain-containing protein [Candidatus Pseudothioglobus singularis]|nr:Wzz/FepE/Etk N-terminal domain-containing protein [Candidatus Pseudothioglobus singularis]